MAPPTQTGPYVPVVIASGWETGLDPALVEKVRQLQALAAEEGITVGITAGHRTRAQQARLYAQGRTAPGDIITYAKPGSSRHETGRAVDIFALKDGKPDYASPAWRRLGELGKRLGLEWGWEWKRFKDRPHFQLRQDPAASPAPAPAPRSAPAGPSALSPTFRQRVDAMAQRLGANPQHLMQVMQFETAGTMDPAIRNRAGSGATGLIQFTPETARELGTTTEALARMTPEEQLVYVEKYLQPFRGRLKTLDDAYMAVLYPKALGKGPDYPLFTAGTRAYQQNAALDVEGAGRVTVGSTMRFVRRKLGELVSPASAEAATPVTLDELRQALGRAAPAAPTTPQATPAPGTAPAAPASGTAPAAATSPVTLDELRRALAAAPAATPAPTPSAPAPAAPVTTPTTATPIGVAPPAPPTADTQVQMLQQQEQRRLAAEREVGSPTRPVPGPVTPGEPVSFLQDPLQYVRESLTGPIPADYYAPKPAPPLFQQAGAGAIPTITTAVGAARFGAPGALAGAYIGRRINVALGLEDPGLGGDVLSVAPVAVPALVGAAKAGARGITGWTRAGKAVQQADEAARAAQQTYQEGVQTAAQQTADQRAAAVAKQQADEAAYQQRVQEQRARAQTAHTTREAEQAAEVTASQTQAVQAATAKTQQQAQEYAAQVQKYEQAVQSQRQAVPQARAVPQRYAPETPAHVLYKKVADIAPEAPVTLTRTQDVAAALQDVLQQVPSLQPSRLQALLTDMRGARSTQSVKEVQRYLTDLGTLTRSSDSATRRTAKQLYGALHDDLAESAGRLPATEAARDLLLQANATFRREMATRDLSGVVSRAITVGDDGIPRLAPGRLLTQFDRLVEGDRFFAGSFTPDELTRLRGDLAGLTTAQKIPARPGAAPAPVQPQAVEPFTPTPFQPPAPPARRAPYTSWKPDVPGPSPPEAVMPTMPAASPLAKSVRTVLRGAGVIDAVLGGPGPFTTAAGIDAMSEVVGHLLLRQDGQRALRALLNADGTVNREALIKLAGGRAALAQVQREKGAATPQEAEQAVGTLRQRYAP